jgi:hypothetical protein
MNIEHMVLTNRLFMELLLLAGKLRHKLGGKKLKIS